MEKILIVSNYYPPEKGAAANRIEQLAVKLSQHNYEVSVVCPLGNYPGGKLFSAYRKKFYANEKHRNITIKRLWIYPSNSKNIAKRLLSIASFSTMLFFYLLFYNIPKKVIVQSPPLLLAFIAIIALKIRRRKIILNVSDLWPKAAVELGVMKPDTLSHKFALFIEKFIYNNSTLVLGQSNEILEHLKTISPQQKTFLYRNFPEHSEPFNFQANGTIIKVFYAGLLGVAQGVLESCKQMQLENLNIEFHIFGDGAERVEIEKYIARNPQKKIAFYGMIDRKQLHKKLEGFDIAYVPLATRIYGSVPSKIFEYSALGMPILYYGGGEGEDIVNENNLGWVVPVGRFDELNKVIKEISGMGKQTISSLKPEILASAKRNFNLEDQLSSLIEKDVF